MRIFAFWLFFTMSDQINPHLLPQISILRFCLKYLYYVNYRDYCKNRCQSKCWPGLSHESAYNQSYCSDKIKQMIKYIIYLKSLSRIHNVVKYNKNKPNPSKQGICI